MAETTHRGHRGAHHSLQALVLAGCVALGGCQLLAPKASDGLPVPSAQAVEADCGAAIRGVDVLADGDVVVVGTVDGSAEIPRLVGRATCQLARRPMPVLVALEMPATDQPLLDSYWRGDVELSKLTSSDFWRVPLQDGRRSKAVAELIANLRRWREAGMNIAVRFVDEVVSEDRDETMARAVVGLRKANPDHLILLVVGSNHAKVVVGAPWDENFIPAAVHIRDAGLDVLSLIVHHGGGEVWACAGAEASSCGPQPLASNGGGSGPSITVDDGIEAGYNGAFSVERLSASPPQSAP